VFRTAWCARCKVLVTARLSEDDGAPHDETEMPLRSRTILCFARVAIGAFSRRERRGGWRSRAVAIQRDDFADGWQALQQDKFAEAESAFRSVLDRDPDNADASLYLGIALAEQGRHGEALAPLRDAAAARPLDAEVHLRLGVSLEALGESFLAMSSLREALTLRPGLRAADALLEELVRSARFAAEETSPARARSPRRAARRRSHRYTHKTMPGLSRELRAGA
jgi:tetratricopeptide (TPR) repeat protein